MYPTLSHHSQAAIDPAVAAVKVKTYSEVAGKATVFVFPDLNTGMKGEVWDVLMFVM